jgi:hypothetical protein
VRAERIELVGFVSASTREKKGGSPASHIHNSVYHHDVTGDISSLTVKHLVALRGAVGRLKAVFDSKASNTQPISIAEDNPTFPHLNTLCDQQSSQVQ